MDDKQYQVINQDSRVKKKEVLRQQVTVEQKQQDLQRDLGTLDKLSRLGAMAVLPQRAEFETKDQEEQVILMDNYRN